jgi:CubicO group peptidase (beta-lactamase class C family)
MISRAMWCAVLLSTGCAAFGQQQQGRTYYPPSDAAGGWRTLKDPARIRKTTGIDVKRLDQAFAYAGRSSQHGGLLVARHGWLVYENYYGKCAREVTPSAASVGKTFTSVSIGMMLEEFRDRIPEGLETRVFNERYLPEAMPLSDPRKAFIKLGHLLAMSAGMQDGNGGTGFVKGEHAKVDRVEGIDRSIGQELLAVRAPMWTEPGGGYFYSNLGTHVLSILVRHITGKPMEAYIREKLAEPMHWGPWGYPPPAAGGAGAAGPVTRPVNTPGAGGIAVRSTDMLRFAYLLLHQGRWENRQLIPAGYIELCSKPTPYQPHAPYSFQFTVNADGHVAGAPRDAYFKSGAGGFGIYVVPSLDLVIWKIAGSDRQYQWSPPGLPAATKYDGSRDGWQPHPSDQFHDPPIDVDTGVRRTLEMVVAAVME